MERIRVAFFDIGGTLGRVTDGRLVAFADSSSSLRAFEALGSTLGVISNVPDGAILKPIPDHP